METISIKLEEEFLDTIEKAVEDNNYTTKTEFIREAIRKQLNYLEKQKALLRLELAYGAGAKKGRNITNEDLHRAREEAAREIAKNLGLELGGVHI